MIIIWVGLASVILLFGAVALRGAPYVPSLSSHTRRALSELAPINSHDVLVDLGSGDGVVLRLAAQRGARAIGYELNPVLVLISRLLCRRYPATETRLADFWLIDLPPETTVIYAFSVTRDMKKLATKVQQTANQAGHPIRLIIFGHTLPSRTTDAQSHSHNMYIFAPKSLQ
ncbi:MAG: hypothetical protein WAS27_03785 [Candidatus Saccharimonadales bacterium]